jgi:uncharacterized membrane protein
MTQERRSPWRRRPRGEPRPALTRVLIAFAVGIATFSIANAFVGWDIAVLLGWYGEAVTYLLIVWTSVAGKDAEATARLATTEDDSRFAADVTLLIAIVISLFVVGFVFIRASRQGGRESLTVAVMALVSLLLSWAEIHTVYMLRYTHLYYRDGGGIDFHDEPAPDYMDFAYVAFTVGMTYQVSDTNITSRAIRRSALRHALLSFVFGTGVIATTVNLIGSLSR